MCSADGVGDAHGVDDSFETRIGPSSNRTLQISRRSGCSVFAFLFLHVIDEGWTATAVNTEAFVDQAEWEI